MNLDLAKYFVKKQKQERATLCELTVADARRLHEQFALIDGYGHLINMANGLSELEHR